MRTLGRARGVHTATEQQMTSSVKPTDHLSGRLLGPEGAAVVATAVLSQVQPECPRLPQLEGEKLVSLTFVPNLGAASAQLCGGKKSSFLGSNFCLFLRCFSEVPGDTKPPCPVVYSHQPSPRPNSIPDVSLLGPHRTASTLPLPGP